MMLGVKNVLYLQGRESNKIVFSCKSKFEI